mmetsp:Transcript_14901/g.44338  ORF Transcript_14901/g.44338 Transcript_14901/m.44338 type:complete len:253 (+) Transcript_14901:388-1146(+)
MRCGARRGGGRRRRAGGLRRRGRWRPVRLWPRLHLHLDHRLCAQRRLGRRRRPRRRSRTRRQDDWHVRTRDGDCRAACRPLVRLADPQRRRVENGLRPETARWLVPLDGRPNALAGAHASRVSAKADELPAVGKEPHRPVVTRLLHTLDDEIHGFPTLRRRRQRDSARLRRRCDRLGGWRCCGRLAREGRPLSVSDQRREELLCGGGGGCRGEADQWPGQRQDELLPLRNSNLPQGGARLGLAAAAHGGRVL